MPQLLETVPISGRVDRERGLIEGVKIIGLTSANGRRYPLDVLRRAAPLYEGARVNINHPEGSTTRPRGYQDRIGRLANVQAKEDGLYGTLQYNPKHPLAEQLAWDAENAPGNVGLSHNIQARTRKDGSQTVVEEILSVTSVDIVADPATTRGLFEGELSIETVTLAQLKESRPDLVEALLSEHRERREAMIEQFVQAGLPRHLVGPAMTEYCLRLAESDPTKVAAYVEELGGAYRRALGIKQRSNGWTLDSRFSQSTDDFVERLTGRPSSNGNGRSRFFR